jgi:hypothetical protein
MSAQGYLSDVSSEMRDLFRLLRNKLYCASFFSLIAFALLLVLAKVYSSLILAVLTGCALVSTGAFFRAYLRGLDD